MVKKKKKTFFTALAAVCVCFGFFAGTFGGARTALAESPVAGADGVYTVPVNLNGLAMGKEHFSSAATVEKSGNCYYMTFGHSASVSDLQLESGGMQTGYTSYTENGWSYYIYTMSAQRIQGSLSFSAYVNAMKMEVNFTVTLDLSDGVRTGEYLYEGERPAEYVPVIETSAGSEYEASKGSVFPIPSSSASLGEERLDVSVSAYYNDMQSGERTEVEIVDGGITLENVGEYHVVYRAESERYKTNFGNNAYSEYDVTITSAAGGTTLAKFEDPSGALAQGTSLLASRITQGSETYAAAAAGMTKIADEYEVFGISLVQSDGTAADPAASVTLYLRANMTYDRGEIVVYHMAEDGTLTKLSSEGYGRYVKVETDRTGTFIVCIPGVAFVMPMWGYAVILVACVFVVAAAVTVTVVLVKKRRRRQKSGITP